MVSDENISVSTGSKTKWYQHTSYLCDFIQPPKHWTYNYLLDILLEIKDKAVKYFMDTYKFHTFILLWNTEFNQLYNIY